MHLVVFLCGSEVERELGMLFSKGRKIEKQTKQAVSESKFHMLVEDVSEGVLVSRFSSRVYLND